MAVPAALATGYTKKWTLPSPRAVVCVWQDALHGSGGWANAMEQARDNSITTPIATRPIRDRSESRDELVIGFTRTSLWDH